MITEEQIADVNRQLDDYYEWTNMPGSGIREELYEPKADLYEAYKSWCDAEGVFPEQKRKFGEHMVEQGYDPDAQKKIAGKNCKVWKGIGLLRN